MAKPFSGALERQQFAGVTLKAEDQAVLIHLKISGSQGLQEFEFSMDPASAMGLMQMLQAFSRPDWPRPNVKLRPVQS